jgi:cytidine deaminase
LSASKLVTAARRARRHARAAYSDFKVGAALEAADGTIITGCNIENATYGLTICAERVAMFKALSEGHHTFRRIAIVADTDGTTPPCGACRQILWEFGGDLEVILANLRRETGRHQLKDLLPLPFDSRLLAEEAGDAEISKRRDRRARGVATGRPGHRPGR